MAGGRRKKKEKQKHQPNCSCPACWRKKAEQYIMTNRQMLTQLVHMLHEKGILDVPPQAKVGDMKKIEEYDRDAQP